MAHRRVAKALFVLLLTISGILGFSFLPLSPPAAPPPAPEAPKPTAAKPKPSPSKRSPHTAEKRVAGQWLSRMTTRDMAAQLVVATTYGELPPRRSQEHKNIVRWVRDLRVGGLIVVNRVVSGSVRSAEAFKMAVFLNRMQRMARVPLVVGGDFERGASMRVNDTIKYPHLMAYGAARDLALTRALGAATAREARALGVHWVFAPVSDVNNNPENPIINIRSFGEDPKLVSDHVQAFIEGAHSDPKHAVLLAAKHFPGHGDTSTDSHIGLATIGADRARMDEVELVPFRAAIAAGVDSIMTAHIAVPALEEREIPATVSAPVLSGVLRKELGFNGLIVTDAMDMQGLARQFPSGEASVRALEAGADVLLMPPDPDAAVAAIVQAVKSGRLTRQRIRESALRVLQAKARVGLHRGKLVDLDELVDELDSPESAAQAQTAAERALTLVKNEGKALPLGDPEKACLFILAENRYGQQGRAMLAEARRLAPKMASVLLDPLVSATEVAEHLEKQKECARPVVAAFVSVGAYRGNVALSGNFTPLVEGLVSSGRPVTMVALGSPYLLRSFPGVSAYLATFSTAPPSEIAAVRALLGQVPVGGKLPVTIPGIAQPGDGLALN